MREIRLYGSEGGGAEFNRLFLPLSNPWRRDAPVPLPATPPGRMASPVALLNDTQDGPRSLRPRLGRLLPARSAQESKLAGTAVGHRATCILGCHLALYLVSFGTAISEWMRERE